MVVEKEEGAVDKSKLMVSRDGKPLRHYYYCSTERDVNAEHIAQKLSLLEVPQTRIELDVFITQSYTFNQPVYIYRYLSLKDVFEKHHKHVSNVELVGEFKITSLAVARVGILDNPIQLSPDTFDVFDLELKTKEEVHVVIGRTAIKLIEDVRFVGWVGHRGDVVLTWCSLSNMYLFEFINVTFVINTIIAPLIDSYCQQFMIDYDECDFSSDEGSVSEGARVVAVDFLNLANHVYNELKAGRFNIDMVATAIHDKLKDYRHWGVIDSRMMERFTVLVFVVVTKE